MSAEKNHEQYLEQIEVAVAETTKELMTKHLAESGGDLRAMAKLVAEKQVEINRLKEYQDNDRKTIRSLRAKLKEAVKEIEELKPRALEFRKMADDYDNLSLAAQLRKEENDKLKEEIELQKDYIDAIPRNCKELECILDQAYLDYHAEESENKKLKEEIKELKEENEILNKLKEASISQVSSHVEQIVELKEENKQLKEIICVNSEDPNAMDWIKDFKFVFKADREFRNDCIDTLEKEIVELKKELEKFKGEEEIEKVFGVSKEVFEKLMKECPPDPDDYK